MPPIKLPESSLATIHALVRLSAGDFQSFLDALSKAEPSLVEDNFWEHVAGHLAHIDPALVKSMLDEIFQMEKALNGTDIDELADTVVEAVSTSKSERYTFSEADAKTIRERLGSIFTGRKGFNITRKALGVVLDQNHVYFHAKILTDIRPVFNDNGDSVDAAVIVHNLRIHYGKHSDHKDFYVALDTDDIQSLREVLDRAEAKAKCLEGILKVSGVSYLNAEEK